MRLAIDTTNPRWKEILRDFVEQDTDGQFWLADMVRDILDGSYVPSVPLGHVMHDYAAVTEKEIEEACEEAFNDGYEEGASGGYQAAYDDGYDAGYEAGYEEAKEEFTQ